MNTSRSVENLVALVTGAGSGIGRAIAQLFVAEGATVVGVDLDQNSMADIDGCEAVAADVTDENEIAAALAHARATCGPIDILINNAGVSFASPLDGADFAEHWQRTLAVNLTAPALLLRHCRDDLARNRAGRVVNIASTEALGGTANLSAYAAAKHGLVGLTRSLAVELGPLGITVNAVCPGPIRTGMTAAIPDDLKQRFARRATAVGRYGEPHEIADMVLSLSLPSNTYTTGAVVAVDGGMTARSQ